MLTQSSRGVLAFLGLVLIGAALGRAGWDPFGRPAVPAEEPHSSEASFDRRFIKSAGDAAWQEQIKREISARSDRLRVCVDDPIELGVRSSIGAGTALTVPLRFTLSPAGIVSEVVVGSMPNTATDECVRSRLQSLLLTSPQHDAEVSLALSLVMEGAASFTAGQPLSASILDPSMVRQVEEAHRRDVVRCYRAALADDPEARESIRVQLWVTSSGEVAFADLLTRNAHAALATCVKQAVTEWIFPAPPDEGGHVSYVFNFTPTGW